jgi:hypothetical protein
MICPAEVRRCYATRPEAWEYLASRGFACGADSRWINGRWIAEVRRGEDGFDLTVRLRLPLQEAA